MQSKKPFPKPTAESLETRNPIKRRVFSTTESREVYRRTGKTYNEVDIIVPFHGQYDVVSEGRRNSARTDFSGK